jgi:hypothetical protein
MLVYRSLVLGLLGACVMLLAQRPATYIHISSPAPDGAVAFGMFAAAAPPSAAPRTSIPPTIIDVGTSLCMQGRSTFAAWTRTTAASCDAIALSSLLHLAPDERIVAVQDQHGDVDVASALTSYGWPKAAGSYTDLTVSSPRGERRILVLMH